MEVQEPVAEPSTGPREELLSRIEHLTATIETDAACRSLSSDDVKLMASNMLRFNFKAGEHILRAGEMGTRFYALASGSVDLVQDGVVCHKLSCGSTVGAGALTAWHEEPYDVVAREDTIAFGVDGAQFLKLLSTSALRSGPENRSFVGRVPLFQFLPTWVRGSIADLTPYTEILAAGEFVCHEGLKGFNKLRILKSGKLNYVRKIESPHTVRRFEPGDVVGAGTLLPWRQGLAAAATVEAECRSEILCIPGKDLRAVLRDDSMFTDMIQRTFMVMGLNQIKLLSGLSRAHKIHLVKAMEVRDYSPNELVDTGTGLSSVQYAHVMNGLLRSQGTVPQMDLGSGQIFLSPDAFFPNRSGTQTYVGEACPDEEGRSESMPSEVRGNLLAGPVGCKAALLTRSSFATALAELGVSPIVDDLEDTTELAEDMLMANRIPILRHLSREQVHLVLKSFVPSRYAKGSRVIEQGELGTSLYVVASGVLEVQIGGTAVRTLGKNGSFGDRGLLFQEPRSATVVVLSDMAVLWCLEKADFVHVLTEDLRSELVKRMDLQDTNVELSDLTSIRLIGEGGFGRVSMVQHKKTGLRYALKQVRKEGPTGQRQAQLAIRESELLAEMDHPFTLQLVKTLETDSSVYILTDLITGGDLYTAVLQMGKPLTHCEAQFYIGSLLLALEHLHDRDIVYRDLKLENVMLDARGYIKLIDFGIAKRLDDTGRTFTCLGTPHYMAPEMLQNHGYGTEVDVWALGVLLHILVCRRLPFGHVETDPAQIRNSVLKSDLEFPQKYKDQCGRALIQSLLCRRPERRLGAGIDGLDEVRQHAYFRMPGGKSLFEMIIRRELMPPVVPEGERYSGSKHPDHGFSIDVARHADVSSGEDQAPG
ncbi:unnamed protein product [Prorocentrum cordatum]|uniref:cGMP-dependent protein kinase n=1 Tax=Prorocentrum cordatum TaxID=2364126 RepID=A0ABN9XWF2_9DINO|nr:unnamed protein product [Polarella glacialis]